MEFDFDAINEEDTPLPRSLRIRLQYRRPRSACHPHVAHRSLVVYDRWVSHLSPALIHTSSFPGQ